MLLLEHSYLGYKLNSDYVGFADLDGESSAAAKPNGAAANGGANGGGGRRRATPLIAAAHRGLSQVVQRLLSSPHNADPSVDCDGVTARDVAAAPPKLNGVNGAANKPDPKLKTTPTEDLRDRRAICLQVLDDHRKVERAPAGASSSGGGLSPLKGKTVGELQDALRTGALSPPTQGVRSSTTGGQVSDLILGTPHQLGEQHPHAHIMDVASMGGCSSSSSSSHSSSSAAAKAAAAGVGLGPAGGGGVLADPAALRGTRSSTIDSATVYCGRVIQQRPPRGLALRWCTSEVQAPVRPPPPLRATLLGIGIIRRAMRSCLMEPSAR